MQRIIKSVIDHSDQEYVLSDGVLYKRIGSDLLLIVPRSMQSEVILQVHEQSHFGWRNTEYQIRAEYWFPTCEGAAGREQLYSLSVSEKEARQS